MKLVLEHLGRLESGTLDLGRDLLIFAGPNNTSKTYAAYLLYGLFGRYLPPPAKIANDFDAVLALFGLSSDKATPTEVSLEWFIDHSAGALLDAILETYGNDSIKDTFAATGGAFARSRLQIQLTEADRARMKAALSQEQALFSHGVLQIGKGTDSLTMWLEGSEMPDADSFSEGLMEVALWALSFAFRPCRILPAERSAIQLFSRELFLVRSETLGHLAKAAHPGEAGRRRRPGRAVADLLAQVPRYPIPIQDTLKVANDLAVLTRLKSQFAGLADDLERQVLQGSLSVSEEGQVRFLPAGSQDPLDIHLASSSVKSLSLLTFYLRHLLEPGDLLIVDEPELNLHPDNQRRVARVLARLVRSGVQVVLSTHSDYIIREINNLIMLSSDPDGVLRQELGYAADEVLRPEEVGVYLFHPTGLQEVSVEQTGFAVATIDREINQLNNTAERIYLSLFGERER